MRGGWERELIIAVVRGGGVNTSFVCSSIDSAIFCFQLSSVALVQSFQL